MSQAAGAGAGVCLWPMKQSGSAELGHTWRGKPSGHRFSWKVKDRINLFYSACYGTNYKAVRGGSVNFVSCWCSEIQLTFGGVWGLC